MKSWFIRDGRLRSGWRVALYVATKLLLAILIGVAVGGIIAIISARRGISPEEVGLFITELFRNIFQFPALALGFEGAQLIFAFAVIWIFRRWIDRRSFGGIGFQFTPGWALEFFVGFGFVVAAWCIIFALALGIGGATFIGFSWNDTSWQVIVGELVVALIFNLMVGVSEEADARGYMLQNLAEGIRFLPAAIASSFYFAILHRFNPGAGILSTIGIFVAGMLLASGYYATRRLWFPIGMHAAWNFAEGPVFGFPVSGLDMGGLIQLHVTGPEWLMGGAFGPEAGALAMGVQVIMIAMLFAWARRK